MRCKTMITIYGIPNCDTMKKARKWLEANDVDYEFHDYKKMGVPEDKLKSWVKQAGWDSVLNKRGTTWRKLDDKVRENIDEFSAIQIMLSNPSHYQKTCSRIGPPATHRFQGRSLPAAYA